jgi:transcriptional regulator with XRE-family HTH domain
MSQPDVKALFGRRVRELRHLTGLSQEAFAAKIGLDRSYVGSVERGERNISIENIFLIAEGLRVAAAELLRFESIADDRES